MDDREKIPMRVEYFPISTIIWPSNFVWEDLLRVLDKQDYL